tara:strand:+ start:540 stop:683 length:144 start_codon:yes stop_codon:yes gene_type:complete
MAKGEKDQDEPVQTALVVKPVKSESGNYKFKRVLAKLTPENKKALGV